MGFENLFGKFVILISSVLRKSPNLNEFFSLSVDRFLQINRVIGYEAFGRL